ncbi:hypothetical protein BDW_10115 [Bdellovibrio bacteriovorus W]|nr:hypothetical protein BDW_10115 [Bdellovibrio bacteriovorus W]
MRLKSQRGMTLIEIMIALAISVATVSVFLTMAFRNRTHKTDVDFSVLLKEVLTNNIIEVKGRGLTELPQAETCLVRVYNLRGDFISENPVSGSGDICSAAAPAKDQIQVIWKSVIAVTSDAEFQGQLELPTQSDTLRKVTLTVRALSRGTQDRELQHQMTVFKR